MKKIMLSMLILLAVILSLSCTDAQIASNNLSKAAEQFELNRRIVFFNGITDKYLLVIVGRCSIETTDKRLAVTCKIGDKQYKKHYLGLSDNVSYLSEQLESSKVDVYHYRIIFKPQAIIPNIDVK